MKASRIRAALLIAASWSCMGAAFGAEKADSRPNILWILGEDMGPQLGCYGDPLVKTPNLDRLAGQGIRFTRAFTTAPVCSASRSALITGMYQTTIGAHHHRSHRDDGYRLPDGIRPITDLFREAGYFTANVKTPAPGLRVGGKTDFNFTTGRIFDGTDWSQRKPGQPFFAQINFKEPHRGKPQDPWGYLGELDVTVDPAHVELPPYYPDDAVVRRDWAGYLDAIGLLDQKVGKVLQRLEDEGIAENTVVFFMGDNGRCHVRGKQFLYDGGIHVPLMVRWPARLRPAQVRDDLISAIDVSATSLSLAGIEPPARMQGRVFLGWNAASPRTEIFAARDRCDETIDRIRCVRTERYKYIRNFLPERPYAQENAYKTRSYPALGVLKRLHADGKLTPIQALFMAPARPKEELYDLSVDPHEVKNLAGSVEYQALLRDLRGRLDAWMVDSDDQGRFPEKKIWLPKRGRRAGTKRKTPSG